MSRGWGYTLYVFKRHINGNRNDHPVGLPHPSYRGYPDPTDLPPPSNGPPYVEYVEMLTLLTDTTGATPTLSRNKVILKRGGGGNCLAQEMGKTGKVGWGGGGGGSGGSGGFELVWKRLRGRERGRGGEEDRLWWGKEEARKQIGGIERTAGTAEMNWIGAEGRKGREG
eukprot:749671-Hanusia_phi.AAC.5